MANKEYNFNHEGGPTSAKKSIVRCYNTPQIEKQRDEQSTETLEFGGSERDGDIKFRNNLENEGDTPDASRLRTPIRTSSKVPRPKVSTAARQHLHLLNERINVKKVF